MSVDIPGSREEVCTGVGEAKTVHMKNAGSEESEGVAREPARRGKFSERICRIARVQRPYPVGQWARAEPESLARRETGEI